MSHAIQDIGSVLMPGIGLPLMGLQAGRKGLKSSLPTPPTAPDAPTLDTAAAGAATAEEADLRRRGKASTILTDSSDSMSYQHYLGGSG